MIASSDRQQHISGYHLLISFNILEHRRFIFDDSQYRSSAAHFWLSSSHFFRYSGTSPLYLR